MDNASVDPGSTAGGGKPDLPNAGFTAQADVFDTRNNYSRSDFDRTQRFSARYVYELPSFGSKSRWATLRPHTATYGWARQAFTAWPSGAQACGT